MRGINPPSLRDTSLTKEIKKVAFTLAEVLITLGIIGVVAALTMPSLIQKYQDKARVTALEKVYSVLENAYRLVLYDNGGSSDFGLLPYNPVADENGNVADINGYGNAKNIYERFKPYLKIVKVCDGISAKDCFAEIVSSPFNDYTWALVSAQNNARRFVILNDGTSVGFLANNINYGGVPNLYVDINGLKKPNKVGVDIFQFKLGEKSLEFLDNQKGTLNCYTDEFSCSAWVIINKNMDYLHCDGLSWNGKRKCK